MHKALPQDSRRSSFYCLLALFGITLLFVISGVSIIAITIDFLAKTIHFTDPERSKYTISTMATLFLSTIPACHIGKRIGCNNAVVLGCIMCIISLILLSLTNIVHLGAAMLFLSLTVVFFNLLYIYIHIAARLYQRTEIAMVFFYASLVLAYVLGLMMQEDMARLLGDANSFLAAGMVDILALFAFIFTNHFLLPEDCVGIPAADRSFMQHVQHTAWVVLLAIAAVIVIIQSYSLCMTIAIVAPLFVVLYYLIRRHHLPNPDLIKRYIWFYLLYIAYWTLSGIANFLFNNIRAEKFWVYSFSQWFTLNTLPAEMISIICILVGMFVLAPLYLYYATVKHQHSALRILSVVLLLVCIANISLWLPSVFYDRLDRHAFGLPFYWVLPYQTCYTMAETIAFSACFSFAFRLFRKLPEWRITAFAELNLIGGISWALVAIILGSISWEVSQATVGQWRAIYPGISGVVAVLSLLLSIVSWRMDNRLPSTLPGARRAVRK